MKKLLLLAVAGVGAAYARKKVEQQREKDLYAAASAAGPTGARGSQPTGAWAAASDSPR